MSRNTPPTAFVRCFYGPALRAIAREREKPLAELAGCLGMSKQDFLGKAAAYMPVDEDEGKKGEGERRLTGACQYLGITRAALLARAEALERSKRVPQQTPPLPSKPSKRGKGLDIAQKAKIVSESDTPPEDDLTAEPPLEAFPADE